MSDQDIQIEQLAEAITNLVNFVPETRDDLHQWYDQGQCILDDHELLRGAPHFLWHYLSDADIRMKSEAMLILHRRRINLILQHLIRE